MPNIAALLKEEIIRLCRRELRGEIGGLKKAASQYRTDIAALKKRVTSTEKQLKQIEKICRKSNVAPSPQPDQIRHRFSPKRLHANRQRLGLSAADAGFLLNVSAATIYSWETGKTRPRPEQIPAIAALRKLGKREARAIIDGRRN